MFDALAYFAGAYLHQDVIDDYGDLPGAVADFVSREQSRLVVRLIADIDVVLRRFMSEEDIRSLLLDQMGSYYLAEADSMTYSQWLKHLRALFVAYSSASDLLKDRPSQPA